MKSNSSICSPHSFHIPVMGLGYTIDTPLKVARYGINSVVSIIQDELVERMREYYCTQNALPYHPIKRNDEDRRARRITAYLNLMNELLQLQIKKIKCESFCEGNDIDKYFLLLPDDSPARKKYIKMLDLPENNKHVAREELRGLIVPGSIDVNIMTKADNVNYSHSDGSALPYEFSDAASALRGYAQSDLLSSLVFSAGMNPRLFGYLETFNDFYPDQTGQIKKKIIIKVTDFRSAEIQGKFLAKKGLFVSEFRIESGLNCGGHAFPTDGILMGVVLDEFRVKKAQLNAELIESCNNALFQKNRPTIKMDTLLKVSVQGGIGTAAEDSLMRKYYGVDSTGWGSPFLMVPEATNVDEATLLQLKNASSDDLFVSQASPFGIPFNNFKRSSSQYELKKRINKGVPGSPCYYNYLAFNVEFTERPICVSSRKYQKLKIKKILEQNLPENEMKKQIESVAGKECLCDGLSTAVLIKNKIKSNRRDRYVAICPGPNILYFKKEFTLQQMIDHIYGRENIISANSDRQHVFIKELQMYLDHFLKKVVEFSNITSAHNTKGLFIFKENILKGIQYYQKNSVQIFGDGAKENPVSTLLYNIEKKINSCLLPLVVA